MKLDLSSEREHTGFARLTDTEVTVPTGLLDATVYFKSGAPIVHAFHALGYPTTEEQPYELHPIIGSAQNGSASFAEQFVGLGASPDERQYRCVYSPEPVTGLEYSGRLNDISIVGRRYRSGLLCLSDPVETTAVKKYLGWRSPEQITVFDSSDGWLPEVLQRMGFLLSLPPKWDSHRAIKISEQMAAAVLTFLQEVMNSETLPPSIVPLEDGGLQIEWHRDGIDAEIEFEPDEPLEIYIREIQTGEEHEGDAIELFRAFALADRFR